MSVQAIDWALRLVQGITPTQKLILICLANHAGPDGRCWPAQETLSEYSGLARQTINRTLSDLESLGFIKSSRRKDESGRDLSKMYRLDMAKIRGVSESDTGVSGDDRKCHPGRQGGVSESDTKQQQEPSLEPSKKTTTDPENVVVHSETCFENQNLKSETEKPSVEGEGGSGSSSIKDLLDAGVNIRPAQKLAKTHKLERIRMVIEYARKNSPDNLAGWIVQALKEGWTFPDLPAEGNTKDQYQKDLDWWKSLAPEKRQAILRRDRNFGSNSNFPDPEWLSKIREEFEQPARAFLSGVVVNNHGAYAAIHPLGASPVWRDRAVRYPFSELKV